ncbi:MAG: hypothetical protein K1X53_06755 [Candidatus Sumerlaeaceae bacterium]|nr:hypothetical protein [Candidatus Sumerlaeaceae bacterium]
MRLLPLILCLATLGAAVPAMADSLPCAGCQRTYMGRTYRITGYYYYPSTWCDACGKQWVGTTATPCDCAAAPAPRKTKAAKKTYSQDAN